MGAPVGQQGDVGAAGGEPVHQILRGGKNHVGGGGQGALPGQGQIGPLPVAVVDQTVVVQAVQQMDVLGGSGPQQGGAEAVAGGFGGDESGQLGLLHAEQAAEALIYGENGGKNVGGDILFHLAAFFRKAASRQLGAGEK